MDAIEERNLVWYLLELLIEKHDLRSSSEFLDPEAEDHIVFGNFIEGHPMCFDECMQSFMAELTRKLPSDYIIAKDYKIDTGSAIIGIVKK